MIGELRMIIYCRIEKARVINVTQEGLRTMEELEKFPKSTLIINGGIEMAYKEFISELQKNLRKRNKR